MGTPTEDIAATLAELCGCWNRLDQPAIRDLWDSEETEPYFLPQEIKEPIIGWDGLAAYYATAQARLVRCSMRTWDIHAKLLSPDLAVALYQMHWKERSRDLTIYSGLIVGSQLCFANEMTAG